MRTESTDPLRVTGIFFFRKLIAEHGDPSVQGNLFHAKGLEFLTAYSKQHRWLQKSRFQGQGQQYEVEECISVSVYLDEKDHAMIYSLTIEPVKMLRRAQVVAYRNRLKVMKAFLLEELAKHIPHIRGGTAIPRFSAKMIESYEI